MLAAFGILAGILQLVATAPYIRDTMRGSTQPHRATWGIWGTLAFVVFASQWASGGTWSLALAAGQALACGIVFVLAIRRGVGGVSPLEVSLLGIAALGIAGWQIADDPVVATCAVVAADVIGVGMMVPKTYRQPASETLSTYAIGLVSTGFAIAAVGEIAPALLVYPLYVLIANSVVIAVILLRRRSLARSASSQAVTDAQL